MNGYLPELKNDTEKHTESGKTGKGRFKIGKNSVLPCGSNLVKVVVVIN